MKTLLATLGLALILTACGQGDTAKTGEEAGKAEGGDTAADQPSDLGLDDKADKRSYALGMDIGRSLRDVPVDLSLEHLTRGITDVLEDREPLLGDEELRTTMQTMMSELESAREEQASAEAGENAEAGEAFLAENKDKEGVEVTDSGLQYKVVEEGDGPSPESGDSVTVHYEGRLIDGTVFDSSHERGEPVTFPVEAVIPGWTEALQLMQEGAEYRLFIPPDLAYGERGAGAKIGPNETLVFDVELLEVAKDDSGNESDTASGSGDSESADGESGDSQ